MRFLLNSHGICADKVNVKRDTVHLLSLACGLLFFQVYGQALRAGEVEGTIIIKHKLTKKAVTASINTYERGVPVELGADTPSPDPLAYERTHVVIFLDAVLPGRPTSATLEQKGRRFVPDLVAISSGSTVLFPNSDPIFHNVFSLSKPKSFDLGNYSKGQTRVVTFTKAGVVLVNCRLHSNMAAVIFVAPNQYVVRADENGKFTLHDVPPGKYAIVAWHKTAGFFRQMISITEQGRANAEFVIPLDEHGIPITTESASR